MLKAIPNRMRTWQLYPMASHALVLLWASWFGLPDVAAQQGPTEARLEQRGKGPRQPVAAFDPLFSEIRAGLIEGERLWRSVRNCGFTLSSDSGGGGFYFEYIIEGPASDGQHGRGYGRALNESNAAHTASLWLGRPQLPGIAFIDRSRFFLRDDASWSYGDSGRWAFIVDRDHQVEHSDSRAAPEGCSKYILFDLVPFLEEAVGEDTPLTHWHPVSRTVTLRKPKGTVFYLRFRSPNDALRYGTVLGELRIECSNSALQCYRAFQQTPNTHARLRLDNPRVLAASVGAKTGERAESIQAGWEMSAKRAAAMKLWAQLTAYEVVDCEPSVLRGDYQSLGLGERILLLINVAEQLPSREAEKRPAVAELLVVRLTGIIRSMIAKTQEDAPVEYLFPDDSAMIYRETEGMFGSLECGLLVKAAVTLLSSPLVSEEAKTLLCDALGDWGYAPILATRTDLRSIRTDRPFYDAILRSRWQWPCEPPHIQACLDALRLASPGGEIEAAAVETLIRLDALGQVPKAALDRWYAENVVHASGQICRESLSVLTAQPTGRDFVIQRLKNRVDGRHVEKRIAMALAIRLRATLETKRFDFIPKQVCVEILDFFGASP